MKYQLVMSLATIASAASFEKRATYSGVATFNNYAAQGKYVFKPETRDHCYPEANIPPAPYVVPRPVSPALTELPSVTFPPISGAVTNVAGQSIILNGKLPCPYHLCESKDANPHNSNGQNPISGYTGPACPTTTCGECFQVCNAGGYGGASVGGVGNCITVNVIDA